MRSKKGWFLLGTLILAAIPAAADTVYLQANFNDKPLDTPIGTGGPTLGEPVQVGSQIIATVRADPLATPSLEIQDNDDYAVGCVLFEFLGSAEITTGTVAVMATLWFHEPGSGHSFCIYVREQGSSAHMFTNLNFQPDRNISYGDQNTFPTLIGTYQTGRPFTVAIVYDLDAGHYDVYLDNSLALANEPHGITERGVGAGSSHRRS